MSESSYYECCGNFGTHTSACHRKAAREARERAAQNGSGKSDAEKVEMVKGLLERAKRANERPIDDFLKAILFEDTQQGGQMREYSAAEAQAKHEKQYQASIGCDKKMNVAAGCATEEIAPRLKGVYVANVCRELQPMPPVASVTLHLPVDTARWLVRFLEHARGRDPYNMYKGTISTPFCPASCSYDEEVVSPILNALKPVVGQWRDSAGHTSCT